MDKNRLRNKNHCYANLKNYKINENNGSMTYKDGTYEDYKNPKGTEFESPRHPPLPFQIILFKALNDTVWAGYGLLSLDLYFCQIDQLVAKYGSIQSNFSLFDLLTLVTIWLPSTVSSTIDGYNGILPVFVILYMCW